MGPAWAQTLLRGTLLLHIFWALLSSVCCNDDPPAWRITSSEVVIPRKMPHRASGAEMPGLLSYSMRFHGRRHIFRMKVKKRLLPRHFPVITDNDQGAMQEDYPFVPRDCYYYSFLEGVPGSMATMDTCHGGLRGMLQVDDFTYEIKPLEASSKFEHVVSLLVSEGTSGQEERCKNDGEEINPAFQGANFAENPRAAPLYPLWPHKKYLKIHYHVSNSLYKMNTNMTQIIEKIIYMNNVIHTIYSQVHIEVHVHAIFAWNERDKSEITNFGNAAATISDFGIWKWKAIHRSGVPHDTTILLTGHKIGGETYFSNYASICNPNWGALFVFIQRYHIFLAGSISAHLLGHMLGLHHDKYGCYCFRRSNCVMSTSPGLLDVMSNCSYERIHLRLNGWDPCMSLMYPQYTNFPYIAPRCGDKIVNQKEQCDCGSFKECSADKCCGSNCALTLGSICDKGDCCRNCRPSPPGTICREILGICDLPEYCDGKKKTCPADFHVQDGTPCSPLAVCMKGNCSDRNMQCQSLFGYQVTDAGPACYKTFNLIGDRFGNCGVRILRGGGRTVKCQEENIFCGLLHCSSTDRIPGGGEHTTFRHIIVPGVKEEKCFGYETHFGTELPYMGLVVDGATCGPASYCVNQNCTHYQDLGFDCDVKKCSYNGVCNNQKHCHCQRGWRPPKCDKVGLGGSEDSGPPPDTEFGIRAKIVVTLNKILLILLVRSSLFLAALIIGIFSKIATYKEYKE